MPPRHAAKRLALDLADILRWSEIEHGGALRQL